MVILHCLLQAWHQWDSLRLGQLVGNSIIGEIGLKLIKNKLERSFFSLQGWRQCGPAKFTADQMVENQKVAFAVHLILEQKFPT